MVNGCGVKCVVRRGGGRERGEGEEREEREEEGGGIEGGRKRERERARGGIGGRSRPVWGSKRGVGFDQM